MAAYLVGVPEMDREHELQVQIVRTMREAITGGRREDAMQALAHLLDVTNAHFLAEQLLMRLRGYPAYAHHVQEHDQLVTELGALSGRLHTAETGEADAILGELERWLAHHIATADQALANWLKGPAHS